MLALTASKNYQLRPITAQAIKTPMSMRILNAKIGMVIFVGIAARFATNDMPIEISTSINKPNALPASMTARIAIGTRIQP